MQFGAFLPRGFHKMRRSTIADSTDARRLGYCPAVEPERAKLVLAEDAIAGLKQALAGTFVSDEELDRALGMS
jgi:hypothetical protein